MPMVMYYLYILIRSGLTAMTTMHMVTQSIAVNLFIIQSDTQAITFVSLTVINKKD